MMCVVNMLDSVTNMDEVIKNSVISTFTEDHQNLINTSV